MDNEEFLIPTVERTLRLIELLRSRPEGLAPQEMLLHLDISRSSLFLLLRSLKALGYLEQAEKRGRYRLGARLESWRAAPAPLTHDLLSAFYQESLRQGWEETLVLLAPAAEGPLVLAQIESGRRVRCAFAPGKSYPGLEAARKALLDNPPEAVKVNGYCLEESEESLDLALPVCRDGRRPEAALLLSAPAFRWRPAGLLDAFLGELRAAAARLSYLLGAPAYTPYREQPENWRQPSQELAAAEISGFLQGPWTARLACIRPDGSPHVIPVWQEWDGRRFFVIAWQGSQWAEYVLNNPSVSLTVDEPWPPLRRVAVRGRAALLPAKSQDFDLPALLDRMARRYLGQPSAALTGQVHCAFQIIPERLRGLQGLPAFLPER